MNETNQIPEKYLPLGSVVLLKGGQKNLMVCGFGAVSVQENKVYDYMGVIYPEGQITNEVTLMFNHDQIEKVAFIGYKNEENEAFQKEFKEYMDNYAEEFMASLESADNTLNSETGAKIVEEAIAQTNTASIESQPLNDVTAQLNSVAAQATGAGVISQPLTATPVNTENNN